MNEIHVAPAPHARLSRRHLLGGTAALGVLLSAAACNVLPSPFPPPINRLPVGGRPYFWAGVNYPWKTGQDFGNGAWGHSGVSDPTTYREIDADFGTMAAQGVRVIKWRVFGDGRYAPEFAPNGAVTGYDPFFYRDLDAALEIAARHNVQLVFTLFDSGFWATNCRSGDVQMGGHALTVLNPSLRQSIVDRAITPMLQHVAKSDRVLAYEIIAEPEWGIQGLNLDNDGRTKIPLAPVRDLVARAVTAIHRESHGLATVESNRFSNVPHWQGLGLDYYSFSWYDWLQPYEPLATPAAKLKLDRPLVLGEFPAGGSTYYHVPDVLTLAYTQGYAGAFGWSYWSGDGYGKWQQIAPSYTAWVQQHWNEVGLGDGVAPPAGGPVRQPVYPYTYDDLQLRLDQRAVVVDLKLTVSTGETVLPKAFLLELGNSQPLKGVDLKPAPGEPDLLTGRFTGVQVNKPYLISLGIFDLGYQLRKWFNNVRVFSIESGQLTTPTLKPTDLERPCGS
jgi:hypothetical protein